jgi:hypothetical protein
MKCGACVEQYLVAFRCKGRDFCRRRRRAARVLGPEAQPVFQYEPVKNGDIVATKLKPFRGALAVPLSTDCSIHTIRR